MATTIEQLELEVQSSAGSAVSGIDSLSASLAKLKAATKGGVGLRTVANQLNAFNTAMGNMDSSAPGRISSLASSLEKLRNLGSIKLSSTLATGITSIGQAASSIATTDFSGIERLSTSMQSLVGFSAKGFTSTINALTKLPKVAETLNKMDLDKFTSQIQQLSSALSPLATQLDTIGNAFGRLPSNLQRTISATDRLATANNKVAMSYTDFYSKARMAIASVRGVANTIATWITQANQYIEDVNLFTVSMGEYAEQAQKYADIVSEAVGIDPGEFMRNQGVFNTIIKGFGLASDRAYTMSQNLTQLGYDIASFYNISFENAMQKLQSGISGELEPLRRLGYDLSVARLQQEAYTLGITKKVSAMTQAEKAELRYYAIMTQVTDAQGDMARTLNAPANQLRVLQSQVTQCARALGNIFLPVLSAILPYAIALAKVIRYLADCIASLFGFKLADFTASLGDTSAAVGGLADDASNVADNLGDATTAAKKLKQATTGIDELNIISPNSDSSSGSGSGSGSSGSGLGIDLPTYDFLDGLVESNVNKIFEKMKAHLKEIGELVATIGAALLAWKIAKGVMDFFKMLEGFKGFTVPTGLLGLTMLLSDMNEFKKYLDDFLTNGASFQNIAGMISEFAGMLGDAFVILGNLKIGGALKIIQGVGELCVAIKDISENGINWNNVGTAIRGISNIAIGIGLITSNFQVVGIGMVLQGLLNVIPQIKNVITAIKTGDWSVVDWSDLVIGAIEVIGGIAVALGAFKGLGAVGKMTETSKAMGEVTTATTATSDATEVLNGASSGFSSKLTSLAKNLLLGIAIIAEVAVAAALIVGSIALLGAELQLVDKAWTPVIANAGTVAIAMGVGTAMLVAVGVVTAALGTAGGAMCAQLGIGIAVLAEISVAADLFVGEIAIMGALLDKVGQTWSPVIANAPTVKTGIVTGTALLVAVGVATAALGAATVASAGTIPLAIGLGTALLVELAAAFVVFCESLVDVANELNNNLSPKLTTLNGKLPSLTTNMHNFVQFMKNFANEVVEYTKASAISGLAATIDTIIGWFTEDPIDKLAKDVGDIYDQTKGLNDKLNLAVPELKTAKDLLTSYRDFLTKIESLTNSGNIELSSGLFVNMKEVGQKLVTGFVEGVKSKSSDFSNAANTLVTGFKTTLESKAKECQSSMTTWAKNLKDWFSSKSYGAICTETWQTYAKNIVDGFKNGVNSNYNSTKSIITTWATNIKNWFSQKSQGGVCAETWKEYAKNIVDGFKNGITANYSTSKSGITTWATNIKNWFSQKGQGGICADTWKDYAKNVVTGFNTGISSNYSTCKSSMTTWADNVKNWFNNPNGKSLQSEFEEIGKNVIQGFINGSSNSELWNKAKRKIRQFGEEIIQAGKDGLDEASPSKAFKQIGAFVIEGFNIGLSSMMDTSFGIMSDWTNGVCAYAPTLALAVDTSQLSAIDNTPSINRAVVADVQSNYTVTNDGFADNMETFYHNYVEPTFREMAADMKRQADKNEQTIVKIGNRTVTDAVTTQKKANGYSFVK